MKSFSVLKHTSNSIYLQFRLPLSSTKHLKWTSHSLNYFLALTTWQGVRQHDIDMDHISQLVGSSGKLFWVNGEKQEWNADVVIFPMVCLCLRHGILSTSSIIPLVTLIEHGRYQLQNASNVLDTQHMFIELMYWCHVYSLCTNTHTTYWWHGPHYIND